MDQPKTRQRRFYQLWQQIFRTDFYQARRLGNNLRLAGLGANGKTTWIETLLGIMGDYAKPAAPERTVRRVQRIQAPSRVEWIERPDRVEHDESPAPVAERIADRPAA